jgi:hypothetical protein
MLDALTGTVPPPANWDSSLCFRLGVRVGWLDCSPFRPGTGFLIPCSHSCLLPAGGLGPRDEKIRLFVYGARGLVSVHWTRKRKWRVNLEREGLRPPGSRAPAARVFLGECLVQYRSAWIGFCNTLDGMELLARCIVPFPGPRLAWFPTIGSTQCGCPRRAVAIAPELPSARSRSAVLVARKCSISHASTVRACRDRMSSRRRNETTTGSPL